MKILQKQDMQFQDVIGMEGAKGASKALPIGTKEGAPNFSFRVFGLEPGGHTPYHKHPFEHQIVVLEGDCTVKTEETETTVNEGGFVLMPPNDKHQFLNNTNKPIKFLCAVPKEYE
ncbi:MAG: cupin domain-containing protein [Pseudomonadota bacterium]